MAKWSCTVLCKWRGGGAVDLAGCVTSIRPFFDICLFFSRSVSLLFSPLSSFLSPHYYCQISLIMKYRYCMTAKMGCGGEGQGGSKALKLLIITGRKEQGIWVFQLRGASITTTTTTTIITTMAVIITTTGAVRAVCVCVCVSDAGAFFSLSVSEG